MGDWYLQPDPNNPGEEVWRYDPAAPSPGTSPPPTSMLPTVPPARPTPYPREHRSTVRYDEYEDHQLAQHDLSHLDQSAGRIVNTPKVGPLDEVLIQPPQDPEWRP